MNNQEVLQQLTNANVPNVTNSIGGSPSTYPLDRCDGDCDSDDHCMPGLFCQQNSGYETVPGCINDGSQKKGYDYCVDLNDFDYGFTVTPTGGWDDDWHLSKPLKVNLIAGQNNTIRVQLPPEYTSGPNIDHLLVEGLPMPVSSSTFRNPVHFMSKDHIFYDLFIL